MCKDEVTNYFLDKNNTKTALTAKRKHKFRNASERSMCKDEVTNYFLDKNNTKTALTAKKKA